jgi:hypothetical protein
VRLCCLIFECLHQHVVAQQSVALTQGFHYQLLRKCLNYFKRIFRLISYPKQLVEGRQLPLYGHDYKHLRVGDCETSSAKILFSCLCPKPPRSNSLGITQEMADLKKTKTVFYKNENFHFATICCFELDL